MTTSPDLGIPYLAASQLQPEVTHNDALNLLQMVMNGVITRTNTPPGGPAEGDVYMLGSAPTGAWAGRANALAGYFGTGWLFLPGTNSAGTPIAIGLRNRGLTVFIRDENLIYIWDGAQWSSTGVGALVSV